MPSSFSYSQWDGSQHILDVDAESLLDAMSDDLLEEGDLWCALQRLFRQGAQNQEGQRMPGLQDLLQQLRQRRLLLRLVRRRTKLLRRRRRLPHLMQILL